MMRWRPTIAPCSGWGDEQPRAIARELVKTVHANVTIDWTVRENVRANLRVHVKRRHAAVRVSTRQAGESDADGARAGGAVGQGVGGVRFSTVESLRFEKAIIQHLAILLNGFTSSVSRLV